MPRILSTAEAEEDLVDIVRHISAENPAAAVAWLNGIQHVFFLLSTQPRMGERFRRRAATGEVRRHTFGKYVVYYRPRDDGIEIYRVLHGASEHERKV